MKIMPIFKKIISKFKPTPDPLEQTGYFSPKKPTAVKLADLMKDRTEALSDVEFEQTQEWQDFINSRPIQKKGGRNV